MEAKYVVFLRGINVGGHKKVPMDQLKNLLSEMGYDEVITILNSGNIIIKGAKEPLDSLENKLEEKLENVFGFHIPVIIRLSQEIVELVESNPFKGIEVTKDIRLYITLLKSPFKSPDVTFPWSSIHSYYTILGEKKGVVFSVLDLSRLKTVEAMATLEGLYGKNITTRNFNTLEKIALRIKKSH